MKKTRHCPFKFTAIRIFYFLGKFFIFLPVKGSSLLGSSPCFFPFNSSNLLQIFVILICCKHSEYIYTKLINLIAATHNWKKSFGESFAVFRARRACIILTWASISVVSVSPSNATNKFEYTLPEQTIRWSNSVLGGMFCKFPFSNTTSGHHIGRHFNRKLWCLSQVAQVQTSWCALRQSLTGGYKHAHNKIALPVAAIFNNSRSKNWVLFLCKL